MTPIINRIQTGDQIKSNPQRRWLVLFLLALPGCGEVAARLPEASEGMPVAMMGTAHDPNQCGTVKGTVDWTGEIPAVPMMTANTVDGPKAVPNPHAPAIDGKTRRMAGVVVYLRGVDPAKAKPWVKPNDLTVSASELGLKFEENGRYGFVPHGGEIRVQSVDVNHSVRGRGALTFAMPLPDANVVSTRMATRLGITHLTSGSNIAWASAHVFVCEHPYFAVTDTNGRFAFDTVPAGEYELVCWHPNWKIVGHDRNPETGLICRFHYANPLESKVKVTVSAKGTTTQRIALAPSK